MKKTVKILAAALMAVLASACVQEGSKMDTAHFEKSDRLVNLTMDIELPTDNNTIRAALYDIIDDELSSAATGDGTKVIDKFNGDGGNLQAAVDYYGNALFSRLEELSAEDAAYRQENGVVEESDSSSEFTWEYNYDLMKTSETDKYIVFLSQGYVYMGGAHGGVTGIGYITFDKSSGEQISDFIDPDKASDMQDLIVNGLVGYFKENGDEDVTADNISEYLLLDNSEAIPLPSNAPCPTDEGLMFSYQQYEIACYAAGMPSFIIPYEKVAPYLTPEAKALLDL